MAVELEVKLTRPIGVSELLTSTHQVLRELLRVSNIPAPMVCGGSELDVIEPSDGDECSLVVEVNDHARVNLTVFSMSTLHTESSDALDEEEEREGGTWISIDVAPLRVPMSFALAVALAIVLARRSGVRVFDDSLLLRGTRAMSPDDVFAMAQNGRHVGNADSAASDMCNKFGIVFGDAV